MIPLTANDVKKPLERDLTTEELGKLVGRAEKASDLIEGFIGHVYDPADPDDVVPPMVTRVAARMVARSFEANTAEVPKFADSTTQNMGPFGATTRFNADAASGGPWLAKSDKTELRSVYSGMRSTGSRSDRCY
ncbi:MAG: hypothetical protein K2Y33_09300 [Mycolicibacterium frederiksbergense]|nr:hypothetical protein [Mycolicibacterium frederiksbergense]